MDESSAQSCMIMVTFHGETISVLVFQHTSYKSFLDRVFQKWPLLTKETTSFHYDIQNHSKVCISVEADFISMLYLIKSFKEHLVCMHVVYKPPRFQSPAPTVNFVDESVNCNSSESTNRNVCDEPIDDEHDLPHFDISPPTRRKSLMSDSWDVTISGIGQKFHGGVVEFREELAKYASKCAFKYNFMKNTKEKVIAVCSSKVSSDCPWFVSGKNLEDKSGFVIVKANLQHNCTDRLVNDDTSRLNSKLIAPFIVENVRLDPNYSAISCKNMFAANYGFDISYAKAWRTLEAARDRVYGAYDDSFDQLRWYSIAVQQSNPGSVVCLESDPVSKKFVRFFIAFKACIDGFKHCRPLVFIDATALKGRFKGQLLTATAKDGNNYLFPIAVAIVDAETVENWTFFLKKLKEILVHEKSVCYLSDRNTGLMSSFNQLYGDEDVHFFCLYHLYTNLKGYYAHGWSNEFRKKMVGLLKRCAYAPNKTVFHEEIDGFVQTGGDLAKNFLDNLPYEKWAFAYSSKVHRYGEMTSNAAESFNKWVKNTKALPVTYMIDAIRRKIMEWYVQRREQSSKWTGALCRRKERFWYQAKQQGCSWRILPSTYSGEYEVIADGSFTVNIRLRECTCHQWQIMGFPCAHAVNVIRKHCSTISGIVDPCFFTQTFRLAYSNDIHPVPSSMRFEIEKTLQGDRILPPDTRKAPGRPKRKRIPSFGEKPMKARKKFKCPVCNKMGTHDPLICATNNEAVPLKTA